jgi:hypothetical protein
MKAALGRRRTALLVLIVLPPLVFVASGRVAVSAPAVLASLVAVTAGLLLTEDALRRAGDTAVSLPATVLVLHATPLLWYEVVEPGLPAAAFLGGALLCRWWWSRPGGRPLAVLGRGAALGIALSLLALAADLGSGSPLTVGAGFPPVLAVLMSSRHGVLFWTPLLTVAALGLIARAARGRADAAGAVTALLVLGLVVAGTRPWWSGGFASARVLPALPLLAGGLAAGLEAVRATGARRPLRLAAAAGAGLVAWNLLLMAQYRAEMIPRDDTVAFPAVARNGAEVLSAMAGSPATWPASWIEAARHGLPAARYDLLGGQDVLAAGPMRAALGDLDTEAALLGEGWSVRHACGGAVCREIEGARATVFLPVVDPRPALITVRAQGTGTLRLSLNGTTLAEAVLGPELAEVGGSVGAGQLRRGPNRLVLEREEGQRVAVEAVSAQPRPGER